MLLATLEHKNSYQGELGVQLGLMRAIEIMEPILGSTTIMVNSCDNIIPLRRASIHPEAVTSWWKKTDLIYGLSDVYHSIESVLLLINFYRHQNSGNPESTLTPILSLNVWLEAVPENIMASFQLSPETRNTISVGLSYPYGLPSVSICRVPVHSNLAQSIEYEISKCRLLQYWDDSHGRLGGNWNHMIQTSTG